jgi:D-alanyl-D-alanine carboxypeptidase
MSRAAQLRQLIGTWRHAPPVPPPQLSVGAVPPMTAAVDAAAVIGAASEALRDAHVPAAQIAVRRRGQLLWSATTGAEPADRFVLASTGKLVTACVLLQLAERGALDLDAPVYRRLPDLPNATKLTPRLLLSHRSGLSDYRPTPELATRAAVLEQLRARRAPGGRFAYRDGNFVAAAELAERASGEDFGALVSTGIAEPLGLPGFSCARDVPGTRLTTPHIALLGRAVPRPVTAEAFGPIWGDGPVASSALDLARFTEALFGGELIGPEMLREMTRRTDRHGRRSYGLGVQLKRTDLGVLAGHDGIYAGWTASASIDDATATVVAVTANLASRRVPAGRIASAVREALG